MVSNLSKAAKIRRLLVEEIVKFLDHKAPKEDLVPIAYNIALLPELSTDKVLLQVHTVLDFLAQQIENENADYVTPQILEEGCIYALSKLMDQPYP